MLEGTSHPSFEEVSTPGFDDYQTRRHYRLQRVFRQHMPLALDGGREVLWWCPRCKKAWYERGRHDALLHLSSAQVGALARSLHLESELTSCLPRVICPECAALCLGGVPRLEEYQQGSGYRLSWVRARAPVLFLCTVSSGSLLEGPDPLHVALSSASDLPLAPPTSLYALLDWLICLPNPEWHHMTPLTPAHCEILTHQHQPPPHLAWCGYAWNSPTSPLGRVLVVIGVTFSLSVVCPPEILLACWRQIAHMMRPIL